MELKIRNKLTAHTATRGSWCFIVLSSAATKKLLEFRGEIPGARHTPVIVTINGLSWKTNIIEDKEHGWLFVIKAEIRKKLDLQEGQLISAALVLQKPSSR